MNKRDNKLLRVQLLIEAAELLNEGAVKTKKKHVMDDYLARYGYKGDKKEGTITVDGRKITIDRDTKNPKMNILGNETIRKTCAETGRKDGKDFIHLGYEFEKLKNNKRRDAILNHEIGHLKNHKLTGEGTTNVHRDESIQIHNPKNLRSEKKRYEQLYPDKSRHPSKYTDKDKLKVDNLKKLKKYEKPGTHNNVIEFEADAYARAHENGDHLKRALRDMRKTKIKPKNIKRDIRTSRSIYIKKYNDTINELMKYKDLESIKDELKSKKIDPRVLKLMNNIPQNVVDETRKNMNISRESGCNARSKAMKDKSIRLDAYNESIDDNWFI